MRNFNRRHESRKVPETSGSLPKVQLYMKSIAAQLVIVGNSSYLNLLHAHAHAHVPLLHSTVILISQTGFGVLTFSELSVHFFH